MYLLIEANICYISNMIQLCASLRIYIDGSKYSIKIGTLLSEYTKL